MAKKDLKYSEAIEELEGIVGLIEQDDVDVDELSDNVKRAIELIKICDVKLKNTEEEVAKILKSLDDSSKD